MYRKSGRAAPKIPRCEVCKVVVAEPVNVDGIGGADGTPSAAPAPAAPAEEAEAAQLFVFVHIPKCGGSSFWEPVSWLAAPRRLFFPPPRHNSWNSPGCGSQWEGGTHCSCSSRQSPHGHSRKRHVQA